MKKTLAWMLAILMTLSLCGCGLHENRKDPFVRAYETVRDQATKVIEDTKERVEEELWEEEDEEWVPDEDGITYEAYNLYIWGREDDTVETEEYRLELEEICLDGYGSLIATLTLENKTGHDLVFTINYSSLNGYLCEDYLFEELEAGDSITTSVWFNYGTPFDQPLDSLSELTFQLEVYDPAEYDYQNTCDIAIYPVGTGPEAVVPLERYTTEQEATVADTDDFRFILLEGSKDDWNDYSLLTYVENKTDRDITLTWDEVTMNGEPSEAFFYCIIPAGKQGYKTIWFYEGDYPGGEDIEEISFRLYAFDTDSWYDDAWFNDTCSYFPGA
ncbi:MAG: hypothetical protein MJ075_06625 [Oscillospiraceae bacterium]|nr:hypothetical protein [Oscillospiraceae bacterium]